MFKPMSHLILNLVKPVRAELTHVSLEQTTGRADVKTKRRRSLSISIGDGAARQLRNWVEARSNATADVGGYEPLRRASIR